MVNRETHSHRSTRPPEQLLVEALLARGGKEAGDEVRFRCPVHDDRSPSASYNRVKGTWFCHGCGAKGAERDLRRRLGPVG